MALYVQGAFYCSEYLPALVTANNNFLATINPSRSGSANPPNLVKRTSVWLVNAPMAIARLRYTSGLLHRESIEP